MVLFEDVVLQGKIKSDRYRYLNSGIIVKTVRKANGNQCKSNITVGDVLALEPEYLYRNGSGIGKKTVALVASLLLLCGYSLPPSWICFYNENKELLSDKPICKFSRIDGFKKGDFLYRVCSDISEKELTIEKLKIIAVSLDSEDPDDRFVVVEKEVPLVRQSGIVNSKKIFSKDVYTMWEAPLPKGSAIYGRRSEVFNSIKVLLNKIH